MFVSPFHVVFAATRAPGVIHTKSGVVAESLPMDLNEGRGFGSGRGGQKKNVSTATAPWKL